MKKHWIIYMYLFPNKKRYIGATSKTLVARQGKDFNRYKNCKSVWSAIQEFGVDEIRQSILFEGELEPDEVGELEKYYISHYDSANPQKGYNTYKGGEGFKKTLSSERIEQLKAQMIELGYRNAKRVVSEKTREKQRLAKHGKKRGPRSEETKRKNTVGNSKEKMTEENHIRRSLSKCKHVVAEHPITKDRIEFASLEEAARHFDVKSSAVSRWISGIRKPKNGYIFKLYSPTTTE